MMPRPTAESDAERLGAPDRPTPRYWGAPEERDELTLPVDWEPRPGMRVRFYSRRRVVDVLPDEEWL